MSLNAAFGNALSGLAAASRMSEVVAANLANSLTEGYARRSVDLSAASSAGQGMGVRVEGVARNVNRNLLAERRGAEGSLSRDRTLADGLRGLESDLGSTDSTTSLAGRIQALETSLVSASADPSSDARLSQVLSRLQGVASALNEGADSVQARREKADAAIATQVKDLNDGLQGVARLNADIVNAQAVGADAAGLMDQRQVLMDKIGAIVPIREMDRQGGSIALLTPQGTTLLDGATAATIGFTPSPVITGAMTLNSGGLDGLTINGRSVGADGVGALAGGSLGAAFDLRDKVLPAMGDKLDQLARDLMERFADPATDPTLSGAPGLLTDGGTALDPASTTSLASRIAVNALVDPSRGGGLWRLRDGVGATSAGAAGDSAQVGRWLDALNSSRSLASGGRSGSAAALAASFTSDLGSQRLSAEQHETFANAKWSTLHESELADGVDTDQETEMMMQIEKAYSANARVISVLNDLLQTMLDIK